MSVFPRNFDENYFCFTSITTEKLTGIGGGTEDTPDAFEKLPEMERMPADIGGPSSVGLPRPPTLGRDCDFGNGGRQTFCGII